MKIAIGPVFGKSGGGVTKHILGIKKYSSHKIHTVPSSLAGLFIERDKSNYLLMRYRQNLEKATLGRYDVVHSHVDPWFTNLCLRSRSNKCKWVHTYHGLLYFEEDFPNGLQPWQEEINRSLTQTASKADIKISVAKWAADYLEQHYSIKTEVVPNGVDLACCEKANSKRFIKKYNLSNFVLYVGYQNPVKNPYLFVELASRIPEITFVMIGRNLDAAHFSKERGLFVPKNLVLIGEMTHRDVLDAMSASKVLVVTSRNEGCPTALLEAMGLGKPVVVPNHTGCKEIVCNNDYGFLYELDSFDDLVEKTIRAYESKHFGEKARERISENYDWRIVAKRIDATYES